MHLLVLSAFRLIKLALPVRRLSVSMHLLVLSAFRLNETQNAQLVELVGLNAPFGAQCFPTQGICEHRQGDQSLNAPFGAQCFPTEMYVGIIDGRPMSLNAPFGAQCFPTSQD